MWIAGNLGGKDCGQRKGGKAGRFPSRFRGSSRPSRRFHLEDETQGVESGGARVVPPGFKLALDPRLWVLLFINEDPHTQMLGTGLAPSRAPNTSVNQGGSRAHAQGMDSSGKLPGSDFPSAIY